MDSFTNNNVNKDREKIALPISPNLDQKSPKFKCTHCKQILSLPLPHMIEHSRYCDNYTRDDYDLVPEMEDLALLEIAVRQNSEH
jgi:hypothetical protein